MEKKFTELVLSDSYQSGTLNSPEKFYSEVLNCTKNYKRAAGYFSSQIFELFSKQILNLAKRNGRIYIVCSPALAPEDVEKIGQGYEARNQVLSDRLSDEIVQFASDEEDSLPLSFLSTLIKDEVLEIKIAVMPNGNIFHDKTGILESVNGEKISFRGSINESVSGWSKRGNYETFDVFKSWEPEDNKRVTNHDRYFDKLWSNSDPVLDVIPFPSIPLKKLLEFAKKNYTDFEPRLPDLKSIANRKNQLKSESLMKHQNLTLENWKKNNYRGIFKHATGSGKTITAIAGLKEHINQGHPVLILVPGILLLQQWFNELKMEIENPEILKVGDGNTAWKKNKRLVATFCKSRDDSKGCVILAINSSASKKTFQEMLINLDNFLLVSDEVHSLGSKTNKSILRKDFKKRIGLSATPERYRDEEGTDLLLDYFGGIIDPIISLSDAIEMGRLVPYYYHIKQIYFRPDEEDEWIEYTRKIVNVARQVNKDSPDKELKKLLDNLLINRSRVAKKAKNKIDQVIKIITEDFEDNQHWLVYCEDQEQLEEVHSILRGLNYNPYIYHTGLDGKPTLELAYFTRNGGIMLAIRCLDEGVDIPIISHAVIAASSKNPRQFIQRRGRVLRWHENKTFAHIYDCLVTPNPAGMTNAFESLLDGELTRSLEFSQSAKNKMGAESKIKSMILKLNPGLLTGSVTVGEED